MLVADIKGKLSLKEHISEDFITSSVFTFFNYIPSKFLEQFLSDARDLDGRSFNLQISNPLYKFWPWYPSEERYGNGAEPDVVILSGETAIIIEAKNFSFKTGEWLEEYESEENLKVLRDQLAREYYVGLKKIKGSSYAVGGKVYNIKDFVLIFLTRHHNFPKKELQDTLDTIASFDRDEEAVARTRLGWLSWFKISPILEGIIEKYGSNTFIHKMAVEMQAFLERRDLRSFSGFSFANECSLELPSTHNLFYRQKITRYWQGLGEIAKTSETVFYRQTAKPYWQGYPKEIPWGKNLLFYGGYEK